MKEGNFMQKTISGPFVVRNQGSGSWQLTSAAGIDIVLRGTGVTAPEMLQDPTLAALRVEWTPDAVRMVARGVHGGRHLTARSALVHEPCPRLYEKLPLASFDAAAQRFWRRVFRLIRIPGGRLLLRFVARRGKRRSAQS